MRVVWIGLAGVLAFQCFGRQSALGQDTSNVDGVRLAVAGTLTAGTVVAVHLYQRNAWWQGPRAAFRFENDWVYALNIDKFGHAYGAYLLSHLFTYAFSWIGYSDRASSFYGPVLGLSYQLYVEVEDGFHQAYGFSPGDAFSDIAGAALPLAQSSFPVMKNVGLKWSYYPSTQYLDALKTNKGRAFIDDYQGQIYWVSIDPHFMLGGSLRRDVPPWLGLSVGAAVRNLDELGHGERMFYLSLDYRLSQIETGSPFLHALLTALDFIHWPAPAIGIEGGRFRAGIIF